MARIASTSVAAGGTLNQDVNVGGHEWLTVIAVVGTSGNAAGAAGDASVNALPYLDDVNSTPGNESAQTLSPLVLGAVDTVAATLASSRAYIMARYRVAGLRRVQIQAKNNNVAAKPVEINFDLG